MARENLHTFIDMNNRRDKAKLQTFIASLFDEYEVRLDARRPKRSNAQNRYYHGVLVASFYGFLRGHRFPISQQNQAHEMIASKWLTVDIADPETGEALIDSATGKPFQRVRSTTELNVNEFSRYCDDVRDWLDSEFGIICPDPMPLEEREVQHA